MRYSVHYEGADKNWVVTDAANSHQVMGIHRTKSGAYKHAFAEQERWRKNNPAANYLARVRTMLPRTMVVH